MGNFYQKIARNAIFALILAAVASALQLVKSGRTPYEILPIALAFVVWSIAQFMTQYQIFDLVPISRISYFNLLGDGAIVLDRGARILDVNENGQALFHGPAHDDVLGKPITRFFPDWRETLDAVISLNQPSTIIHRTRYQDEDQQFDVNFHPITNAEGMVTSILVKFQNVTFYTQLLAQLHELAIRDPLTGILNRRHFELLVRDHLKLEQRYQRECSLVMFDLNDFKVLNDEHGHPVGDAALTHFARLVNQQVRESDIFARLGGDEFVLFLPETNQEGALTVLENLWELLEGKVYPLEGYPIKIQTCVGVASVSAGSSYDYDELLLWADRSLYVSKEEKNCIVAVWDHHHPICLQLTADHRLLKQQDD